MSGFWIKNDLNPKKQHIYKTDIWRYNAQKNLNLVISGQFFRFLYLVLAYIAFIAWIWVGYLYLERRGIKYLMHTVLSSAIEEQFFI